MTVDCPTCGDGFSKERFMKSHHKQVHDSYVDSKEDLIEDLKRVSSIVGGTPTYADIGEHGDYKPVLYQNRFGGWNAAIKAAGMKVNLRRDISREEFLSELARLSEVVGGTPTREDMDQSGKFASNAYLNEFGSWNSAIKDAGLEPNNERGGVVETQCDNCGKDLERIESRIKGHTFCGISCHWEYHTGENHWDWDGGELDYGSGWNDAKKEKVRDRDGRRCVNCGRPETEHLEKFGRKHTVHHIQKARSFDDPEKRNAMDNLVTLCMGECHAKWEQMSPLRPACD